MSSRQGSQQAPAPHRAVICSTLDAPLSMSIRIVQSVTPAQWHMIILSGLPGTNPRNPDILRLIIIIKTDLHRDRGCGRGRRRTLTTRAGSAALGASLRVDSHRPGRWERGGIVGVRSPAPRAAPACGGGVERRRQSQRPSHALRHLQALMHAWNVL